MRGEILVIAVGRLRPALRAAADEYVRRLQRYANVVEQEIRETHGASPAVGQRRDDRALLGRVPEGDGGIVVALTRAGTAWTSAELARRLDRWRAARPLTLLLGGSHGLGPAALERASARWSLGPLTLPHELARVVVLEQVYRAFTILEGHPYHKGGRDGER